MDNILESFENLINKPELFLSADLKRSSLFVQSLKNLYGISKSREVKPISDSLPELIIHNCDDEQVWQELELHNDPVLDGCLKTVAKLAVDKSLPKGFGLAQNEQSVSNQNRVKKLVKSSKLNNEDENNIDDSDEDSLNIDNEGDVNNSDEEEEELERLLDIANQSNDISEDDNDEDNDIMDIEDEGSINESDAENIEKENEEHASDEEKLETKKGRKVLDNKDNIRGRYKKNNSSHVATEVNQIDDNFFSFEEMDRYLEKQENDVQDIDEEDINVFADIGDDKSQGVKGSEAKYNDFFDPPKSQDQKISKKSKSKVKFLENNRTGSENEDSATESLIGKDDEEVDDEEVDDEEVADEDVDENEDDKGSDGIQSDKNMKLTVGDDVTKSSYEKRQERLKKKIEKMEEENLTEKPWQLKGEVTAGARPENSLLQEHLEFEHTSRPTPVITEETTQKLTDIIRQRIKDKAWDDVERKKKPVEQAGEYKRRVVLEQEKSGQSLAQIYEQEYLKSAQEKEEKQPKEHEDIQKMMTSLFMKLDALSNFHYTPKLAVPDVKVVSNMPAIIMEEVQPVNVSEGTLLAPEEIKEKRREELKGSAEKTDADKLRVRKKKKTLKRLKQKERDKKQQELASKGSKTNKAKKMAMEKAARDVLRESASGKLEIASSNPGVKSVKSSTAFFSTLHDQVKASIENKKASKKRKDLPNISAAKLRL